MKLISDVKINFKITQIMEGRLTTKKDPIDNINIPGNNSEYAPKASEKGETFLYISKKLN